MPALYSRYRNCLWILSVASATVCKWRERAQRKYFEPFHIDMNYNHTNKLFNRRDQLDKLIYIAWKMKCYFRIFRYNFRAAENYCVRTNVFNWQLPNNYKFMEKSFKPVGCVPVEQRIIMLSARPVYMYFEIGIYVNFSRFFVGHNTRNLSISRFMKRYSTPVSTDSRF